MLLLSFSIDKFWPHNLIFAIRIGLCWIILLTPCYLALYIVANSPLFVPSSNSLKKLIVALTSESKSQLLMRRRISLCKHIRIHASGHASKLMLDVAWARKKLRWTNLIFQQSLELVLDDLHVPNTLFYLHWF